MFLAFPKVHQCVDFYPCCLCPTSGMQICVSWSFTASEGHAHVRNKCPATAFAKCRDKSSDLQTNKCGVWVRGDTADFRLWNSEVISGSLLEALEFHFQKRRLDANMGEQKRPGMWIWRGTKHRVVLRAMWDEYRETEEMGPCRRGPVSRC